MAGVGAPRRELPTAFGAWNSMFPPFPPWPTVYRWFRRLARRLMFRTIHIAEMIDRAPADRDPGPSAAVIDSQTVEAPAAHGCRSYDATETVGRKRHIAIDTDGRLLPVNLTTADVADRAGGSWRKTAVAYSSMIATARHPPAEAR